MSEALTIPQSADLAKEDWLMTRDVLAGALAAVKAVASQADVDRAGKPSSEAKKHIKALAAERLAFTRQLDEAKKAIMAQEQTLAAPLAAEVARVDGLAAAWLTEQARKAEAKRRAELARIEAENQRLAQEARAAELNRQKEEEDARRKNLPPPPPEPVRVAVVEAPPPPPVAAPKADGARVRKRWTTEIVQDDAVPRHLCVPSEARINRERDRQIAAGQDPDVPGVKFAWTMVPEGR